MGVCAQETTRRAVWTEWCKRGRVGTDKGREVMGA